MIFTIKDPNSALMFGLVWCDLLSLQTPGSMVQELHWPAPPFEWHILKQNDDTDELRAQWQHFEPLLASCGYSLVWSDLGKWPDHSPHGFSLPPAADPFSPQEHESFVALPISRPPTISTGHVGAE